jgi:hypothetical protein
MVTTGSIARGCCLASRTSTLTETIRSPFLPAMLAQSSGLVVLGRS